MSPHDTDTGVKTTAAVILTDFIQLRQMHRVTFMELNTLMNTQAGHEESVPRA